MSGEERGTAPSLPAGIPNARVLLDGIVTAGQPTAAHLAQLARAGVKTVIDLRGADEPRGFDEAGAAASAGLEYHVVPVVAGAVGRAEFDAVRALLGTAEKRPVLVHCASANRVGAALIPYFMLDEHRTREEALQIARDVGLRSDDLARTALAYVDERQRDT